MSAPKGNRNAAKPKSRRAESIIYVRVTAAEKQQVERAARKAGQGIAAWSRSRLLNA